MEFKFPDSGHVLKIEGVSSFTLGLLRGWYEQNYPGKPEIPEIKIQDVTEKNPNDPAYKEALTQWTNKMGQARWAGQKLYYASCVQEVDQAAVAKAIDSVASFMSLPDAIRAGYQELAVPFQEELMDKYIYLFHVCITNSAEQQLFEDMIYNGSGPTQEAVQNAYFRLRTKV